MLWRAALLAVVVHETCGAQPPPAPPPVRPTQAPLATTLAAPSAAIATSPPECRERCDAGVAACKVRGFDATRRNTPEDLACAREYFEPACAAGHFDACNNLGYLLQLGLGGPADSGRARSLYERSCDGGHMMGCVNLAATMERTDPKAAYALVEHACERGLPEGCFLQGEKLERGDGVVADPERGRALRARACDAGASFSCK